MVSNEFAPYAYMRDLRIGQTWTVPVYSPFNAPTEPLKMVQASVDRQEPIEWNGQTVRALVVVYRDQATLAAESDDDVVGQMWVRRDGTVLRQDLELLGKKMTFERLPDEQATQLDLWDEQPESPAAVPSTPAAPAEGAGETEATQGEPQK